MKQLKIWSSLVLAVIMMPLVVSCGSDDDKTSSDSSALIGTWVCLEADFIFQITGTKFIQYEIGVLSTGYYLYNNPFTTSYKVQGNKMTIEDGSSVTFSINGDELTFYIGNGPLTARKFDGSPQDFIEYMNELIKK